jgi:hypothetical protein
LLDRQPVVRIDHERSVATNKLPNGGHACDVLAEVGLANLALRSVEPAVEVALDRRKQFRERKVQIDAAAIGARCGTGAACHFPERLAAQFSPQIPDRDVDGGDGECSDAARPT